MPKKPTKQEYMQNPVRDLEEGAVNEATQGRGANSWAGMAFGLAFGAAAGLLIGLAPGLYAAGGFAALSWTSVAAAAALCASIGAFTGQAAGADNGSAAGAAVASTKVVLSEIRAQMNSLRRELGLKPKTVAVETGGDGRPVMAEQTATANTGGFMQVKPLLTGMGLGAAIGAVIWAASYLLAGGADAAAGEALKHNLIGEGLLSKIGFGGSVGAQLLGSCLIGAASGAPFGFNVPRITAKMSRVARTVLNGRIFQAEEEAAPAPQHAPGIADASPLLESAADRHISFREILAAQRAKTGPEAIHPGV